MKLQVKKSRNGKLVGWVENGTAYVLNNYFKHLKAYYLEHGYRNFVIVSK